MKKLSKKSLTVFLLFIGIIGLMVPVQSLAGNKLSEEKIPGNIHSGLRHFLDQVDPEKDIVFDPGLIAGVMEFIEGPKENDSLYFADDLMRLPSAYHEFDIRSDLRKITSYAFNPDIPCIATMPSSVRLFQWMDENGNRRPTPPVVRYLGNLDTPVIEKALQYVEITPDTNSGAYYGYNLYQTLIAFKYRDRNVLVTISRQTDVSSVGKKGYVLGSDDDWDYFYSSKKGLTIPALGWVSSYMYASSAINIYYEIDSEFPRVRCAMFKWLRAGWSGINMVQRKHIYNGLKRFAGTFKQIMEHPALPSADVMAADFLQIRQLSDSALRAKMNIYADILQRRYNVDGEKHSTTREVARMLADESYWASLSRDEMEAALVVEYMKSVIGKTRVAEIDQLLGFKSVQQ